MDSITSPSQATLDMAPELDLISDLRGGTSTMRKAGQRWLPREPAESWTAWRARLNRSVLFNGLSRAIQALSGRPFHEAIQLEGGHETLQGLVKNCNGQVGARSHEISELLRGNMNVPALAEMASYIPSQG